MSNIAHTVSISVSLTVVQWLKTKAAVIVLHETVQFSWAVPVEHLIQFFTAVDAWCVNRSTEPKQNKTFEFRSERPTCAFNLNPPSTRTVSLLLKRCHAAELEPFFRPLKLYWKCWCSWLLSWSFVAFCFWWSICWVPHYKRWSYQFAANVQMKL